MANINSATVKAAVDALTDKVNGVIGTANTVLATASDSVSAAALAMGYRDTAAEHKAGAEAAAAQALQHSADVASAIVYQNLASVALSKNITMVDGCIDTSPNPPLSVQMATSWYNEPLNTATRGSRREMPTKKVVTAEAGTVTIWDGDDPEQPMWMVFTSSLKRVLFQNTVTSVAMLNGILVIGQDGTNGVLSLVNFTHDNGGFRNTAGEYQFEAVANRNEGYTNHNTGVGGLYNRSITDVGLGVAPDAPVDPLSGLRIPTIAAGTGGKLTAINPDGTMATSAGSLTVKNICFNDKGVWWSRSDNGSIAYFASYDDVKLADFGAAAGVGQTGGGGSIFLRSRADEMVVTDDMMISGGLAYQKATEGLMFHLVDYSDIPNGIPIGQSEGVSAFITTKLNTGWMSRTCVAALLSSVDATPLVAVKPLDEDGTSTDGWLFHGNQGAAALTTSGGNLTFTSDKTVGYVYKEFPTEIGKTYRITYETVSASSQYYVRAGTTSGASATYFSLNNVQGLGVKSVIFTATSTSAFFFYGAQAGESVTFGSVDAALADADHSGNGNGGEVFGTVPRTPVATDAQLCGYGPFSDNDYIDYGYVEDLDFGLGDFSVSGWIKTFGSSATICSNQNTVSGVNSKGFLFNVNSNGGVLFRTADGTTKHDTNTEQKVRGAHWTHVVAVVSEGGTKHEVYLNGVLSKTSVGPAINVDAPNQNFVVGKWNTLAGYEFNGWIAQLKIEGSKMRAEQVRRRYTDELGMFRPYAQVALAGTNDRVRAVAYDRTTGLALVGKQDGRSDFSGLIRVNETATPVTTKIIAHDGTVMEQ